MGKPKPKIWWDIFWSHDNLGVDVEVIVVESSHPDYPIIAKYVLPELNADYTSIVELAEQLIKDIEEGRKSFYGVAKNFKSLSNDRN